MAGDQSGDTQGVTSAFRQAIETHDLDGLMALLSPDVIFHSPIVHKPYSGHAALRPVLAAVMQVFEHFAYTHTYSADHGAVLRFRTQVGGRDLEGVDILECDVSGLVTIFTVIVRPYSAATALREAMAAKLAADLPPP